MKKCSNRLRDLRQDKDLTQAQIAKIFFMQTTQYRRYENGESDLPLELAKKFAEYYNVSIDYIAGMMDGYAIDLHRQIYGADRFKTYGLVEKQYYENK